jgi:hypothetical protein
MSRLIVRMQPDDTHRLIDDGPLVPWMQQERMSDSRAVAGRHDFAHQEQRGAPANSQGAALGTRAHHRISSPREVIVVNAW